MSVELWTIILVGLSFVLYIYIGWQSRVENTKDFFIAGQGIPAIANGAATAADWMSAASFISMAGLISFLGYDGSIYLMGWTGGYVLLALLLAPYLRKFGKYTVPDFVGDRYYSNIARLVAVVAAIFISLTYVAGQMRGVGIVFSRFLQVDVNTGVIIGMIIVGFFAVLGGMKGITWTQVAQYCVLIFAYLIPAIAIAYQLTGNPIPQLAFTTSDIADKLNLIQLDLGFKEYTQSFANKSMLDVLFITIALMVGTAGLPHIIVRFYTVKSVRAARFSAGWALLFIAILYTTAPAIGMFSRYNLITSLHNKTIVEVQQLDWANKWEKTKLLAFEDKNKDGRFQLTPNKETNEIIIDKDIIVLSTPEVANLPPWIIALVAAGGLAAALSTASGLLLVISSSVAHDVYYRIFDSQASEKKRVFVGRVVVGLAIVLAGYFGVNPPGFVSEVVAFAFGLAAASFFPVIFLGIFDKRTNSQGAIAGMLIGLIFTVIYIVGVKFVGMTPWFFGVSAEGIGTLGMIINFIVTLTVSRLTPPPPPEIQALVEDLRTPIIEE
ncbi:cation acetate symporter [Dolichospermum sp. LEGE 00240]|jgi:cation/acetate symporter|uniref:sodium:solute symporter family protein n=1 Tax=Dolichospermum sp. LEGE 00240 TaxID=1828603 RepID=UPI00187DE4B9|nr:sodium:solute symporter family protein [Dolichospermum sp. LEGE 00240]MDM3847403.1 cation acetate symporter [Aphanizomenon gracile PMC638.10]MDM3852748.1 cation acetate symporter [Aphanizomenon gracile PMC627.10]MDM3856274.1 cation acetate symporter [Aphanizomenon gracile PMC649.10]MDM3861174.1 cation acetate symporter [Aphanizomenon gracile PMC644.10]MBE9252013.1 cation acetate symporter [Dolichospermum sp. LEGE 00240]